MSDLDIPLPERMRIYDYGAGVLNDLLVGDAYRLLMRTRRVKGGEKLEGAAKTLAEQFATDVGLMVPPAVAAYPGRLIGVLKIAPGEINSVVECPARGYLGAQIIRAQRLGSGENYVFLYELSDGRYGYLAYILARRDEQRAWTLDHLGSASIITRGKDAPSYAELGEITAKTGDPWSAYAYYRFALSLAPNLPGLGFDTHPRYRQRAEALRAAEFPPIPPLGRSPAVADARVWATDDGPIEVMDVSLLDLGEKLALRLAIHGDPIPDAPGRARAVCEAVARYFAARAPAAPTLFSAVWCDLVAIHGQAGRHTVVSWPGKGHRRPKGLPAGQDRPATVPDHFQ